MNVVQTVNQIFRKVPTWLVYIVGVGPLAWYFYLAATGGLGVEPINTLERRIGLTALQFFIAVLAITPLRNLTKLNLIKFRRALGLLVFIYALVHLAVWLFLDVQIFGQIIKDIFKRPYITIGMVGLVLIIPAAMTSNNWSIRKLGPKRWKQIHWFTYPAAVLATVHYIMVQKVWELEPLLYLAAILALLATRVRWNRLVLPGKTKRVV